MSDSVVITYSGQQVSVPKEVADFLEQDRKREQAQDKRDQRHLSKSEFETVLSGSDCVRRPVEDTVLWNLQLECLREAVDGLGDQSRGFRGPEILPSTYQDTYRRFVNQKNKKLRGPVK